MHEPFCKKVNISRILGRGGGGLVAFYSDDPSSNSA